MPKRLLCCIFLVLMCVSGCDDAPKPKIGISFGVGEAKRWPAEQDATVYMDLKSMAYTAVNEAYNMATKKKPNVNSEFDNESKFKIDAFLINGKLITRENIDRVLIAPGHFTHEQIYGN